jgi:polysaccharide biosynthesis protein PslH
MPPSNPVALMVTAFTPSLSTGRGLRTYAVVRALAASSPVELLFLDNDGPEPHEAFRKIEGVRLIALRPSRGITRAFRYARSVAAGVPESYARGISQELIAAIRARVAEVKPPRVVADGPIPRAALTAAGFRGSGVYLAHNVESVVWESVGGRSRRALAGIRAFEQSLFEASEESWLPTDADLALAAEMAPSSSLRYVPNAIDVASIDPVDSAKAEEAALFVGDYTYAPNRQALDFLVESVMPLVWGSRPEARLLLVGRGLPAMGRDARIDAVGYVDDLRDVYERARCALVPLWAGGGSPLKFIEALAYGVPVVATRQAAERLRVRGGKHYLAADSAESFARAMVDLLTCSRADIVADGRRLVEREYSIHRLEELLGARTPA